MPWVQPGLCCGGDEEPRGCGEPSAGHPAGGRSHEGGSPLEGACLQERMHPGERSVHMYAQKVVLHLQLFLRCKVSISSGL